MTKTNGCGHCHNCGEALRSGLLPHTEWCSFCQRYCSYVSHGFRSNDMSPCPRSLTTKSITAMEPKELEQTQ